MRKPTECNAGSVLHVHNLKAHCNILLLVRNILDTFTHTYTHRHTHTHTHTHTQVHAQRNSESNGNSNNKSYICTVVVTDAVTTTFTEFHAHAYQTKHKSHAQTTAGRQLRTTRSQLKKATARHSSSSVFAV